jgi:hypothetical protein
MKIHRLVFTIALSLLVLSLAVVSPAHAADAAYPAHAAHAPNAANAASTASLKILTPADDAHLDAGESYSLQYEVAMGPGDDHFHVWVDGDRSPGIHDLKGTYALPKMGPGDHVITLKLVDKGHVPTGPETSIKVHVK